MKAPPRITLARLISGLFIAAALNLAPPGHAQTPAFPGATGAGVNATGGRDGSVYRVTNLNRSGAGSLADAVSRKDRIVVFDVSGIIDLTDNNNGNPRGGKIAVAQPNITIAGQTAPGEGICLKGGVLEVSTNNVIIRHIRSRRGFIRDGDKGDAIMVKAPEIGVDEDGNTLFAELKKIYIDHCSTTWATDENLTVTHIGESTISWCLVAEGLNYRNTAQTPQHHSEGSLWGSSKANGRGTMHHMLYAHNKLRNPRTTGFPGGTTGNAPVLTFYNSVIYNWNEFATHTGSEAVKVQWLNNYYKRGADHDQGFPFIFTGDEQSRVYPSGNHITYNASFTADNRLAVGFQSSAISNSEMDAMIVTNSFTSLPSLESALDAYNSVTRDAGATLPARDAVDLRIVNSVKDGTGEIIDKETDLPSSQRWPTYYSLSPRDDSDGDGLPNFWESQFGLDANDGSDSKQISNGYANIEHYFNNTAPNNSSLPIAYIAATVSRADASDSINGQWRVHRSGGSQSGSLTVYFSVSGNAVSGSDFEPLAGSVTIAAGASSATIKLKPKSGAADQRKVVLRLESSPEYHVGCPSQSLVVIRQ